jgi:hypothetical protein
MTGQSVIVYGPHCSHDECSWITCDDSGLVEFPCHKPGCPHCGAPPVTDPEHWAGDLARVAAMTPGDQARVTAYLARYPMVRRGPDDSDVRLSLVDDSEEDDEPWPDPDPDGFDPGPEVDDEGGMSEYRHAPYDPEPWS